MLEGILSVVVGVISVGLLWLFHYLDQRVKKEKHDGMSRAIYIKSARDAQYYTWIIFLVIGTLDVFEFISPLYICTTVIIMMVYHVLYNAYYL